MSMKIFESPYNVEMFRNPVLTIGNYDGIHLGHKTIIERVKDEARHISGTPMLMTFFPHPVSVVRPDKDLCLITPLHVRKRLIEENGIEVLFVLPFTEEFRNMEAEEFTRRILVEAMGIKGLIVGYDFKFGKGGGGNTELLSELARRYGFFFDLVDAVTLHGEKIGSNRIRKLLMVGDVKKADIFLGRPHFLEGQVVRGEDRGGKLGFPTVNLATEFESIPRKGVYITEIEAEGKRMPSVTNIGHNPTFNGKRLTIETHILDFSGDLYGNRVVLFFHDRIRDEKRFDSAGDLILQISSDVETARRFFENPRSPFHVVP